MRGFLSYIKPFISEPNDITLENGIVLKLNKTNLTASIINANTAKGDIFIPKSVEYRSQNYEIINIANDAFHFNYSIDSITFAKNSSIKNINWYSFVSSSIKTFNFPPNLEVLTINRNFYHHNLKDVIQPNNKNFQFLNKENNLIASRYNENHYGLNYILYKENINDDNNQFDNLFFAKPDIKHAIIPSTIKFIDDYCFENCSNLQIIEFQEPSSVISIGDYSFFNSTIKEFTIPSSVQILKPRWCENTKNLINLSVSPKNKLIKVLESNNKILVKRENTNQKIYKTILFANRNIKSVIIPSYIETISPFSFSDCLKIDFFDFEKNSMLKEIQNGAFYNTSIKHFFIPDNVSIIKEDAFQRSKYLKTISFSQNSKLISFESGALQFSSIENIIIPPLIKKISNDLFSFCSKLKTIEFLANEICFDDNYLISITNNVILSFPNSTTISFSKTSFFNNLNDSIIFVSHHTIFLEKM